MAERTDGRLAGLQMTISGEHSLIAYLPSFSYGEPALLLSVDEAAIEWLISQFGCLSAGEHAQASFVLGSGRPVVSEGG